MAQRIKGQEVSILVVRDSVLEDTIRAIQNFEVILDAEILEQGYLGRKSNDFDDIFKGIRGSMDLHLYDQAYLVFASAVKDRQQRATPDVVFNISATLSFPNGQTPSILVKDAKFGPIPLTAPNRNEYVGTKLEFATEDADFIF